MLESFFNNAASFQASEFLKRGWTLMFFYENCEIFKNIYFEEHLSRRLQFASPQIIITNSSGKYGQGETTTECKVSIYFKGNIFIQLYSAISLKYKLKMLLLHSINILSIYLTLRDFTSHARLLRCRSEIIWRRAEIPSSVIYSLENKKNESY